MNLLIFDFDNTIFKSPLKTKENLEKYFLKTGKEWKYKGWWGRIETLSYPLIDNPIPQSMYIEKTCNELKTNYKSKNNVIVIMTGRVTYFRKIIINILENNNLNFNHLFLFGDVFKNSKKYNNTLMWKKSIIEELIKKYKPNDIKIWDDNLEHLNSFSKLNNNIKTFHVFE